MNQITVTVDLTPRNLEILKQLCADPTNFQRRLAEMRDLPVVPEPAPKPEPKPEPEPKAEAPAEEAPKISKTDVKAVCLNLSKQGRQAELRAAFEKFGGKKFSDIKESDYPALMEELGNAQNV